MAFAEDKQDTKFYFVIAAQIAKVAWPIGIALTGQVEHPGQQ